MNVRFLEAARNDLREAIRYYPGNQDPHKSLQPIRSSNSRSRLPRDQRSTTESTEIHGKEETVATLPGGWRSVHTIRLEIEPFAELVAHSESLTGSQVDFPDSCRAKLKSAPVTVLQSPNSFVFVSTLITGQPCFR